MKSIIEKGFALIAVIVFVTFMVRHGYMDFSGLDFIHQKTKDVVLSEEGQETISEVKDITADVIHQFTVQIKKIIADAKESQKRIPVSVVRVVDGDTIIVTLNNEKIYVRLIGIDSPESVNPDNEKNSSLGIKSSDYTKDLLNDIDTLYLEFDESTEDTYGRLLAYAWLIDDCSTSTENIGKYMLNGIILKNGYAFNKEYKPNDRYSTSFDILEKEAKQQKNGLWAETDCSHG